MTIKTTKWDVTEFLDNEKRIALFLEAVFEDGAPTLITAALGDIARARGMTAMAKETGITREALYRALSKDGTSRIQHHHQGVEVLRAAPCSATCKEPCHTAKNQAKGVGFRSLASHPRLDPHEHPRIHDLVVHLHSINHCSVQAALRMRHPAKSRGGCHDSDLRAATACFDELDA